MTLKKLLFGIVSFCSAVTAFAQGEWIQQTSPTVSTLSSIHATDSNDVWAVGGFGVLLHTTDGGDVWTQEAAGTNTLLRSIQFVDASTGWMVGADTVAVILHTTDSGLSWSHQTSPAVFGPNSVHFVDSQNGWVVGSGTIIHTTDGGAVWIQQTSGTTVHLFSVYFSDVERGCVVGDEGIILRTTNGGTEWERIPTPPPYTSSLHSSVYFTDVNHGWIASQGGRLYNSTDGGVVWTEHQVGTLKQFYSIYFVDAVNGWVVSDSEIFHTRDGGAQWNRQYRVPSELYSVFFAGLNHGWTVGENGIILHYQNVTSAIQGEDLDDEGRHLPVTTALLENYPNPFNPSTTIRYALSEDSHVALKVYNMLGQLVATLVDEPQSEGYESVVWSGQNDLRAGVASGIYIYRISAGRFSATKRMLLLK